MRFIRINQRKWPDTAHWQFDARWLGEDTHGTWVYVSKETMVQRGIEQARTLGVEMVGLIPNDSWWMVEFYRDHPNHLVYVNIGTVPTWDGDTVTQIDLDLDVIRKPNGSVEIIDEDEFDQHRITLDYPPEIIFPARRAAERAAALLRMNAEPFAGSQIEWWPETKR